MASSLYWTCAFCLWPKFDKGTGRISQENMQENPEYTHRGVRSFWFVYYNEVKWTSIDIIIIWLKWSCLVPLKFVQKFPKNPF